MRRSDLGYASLAAGASLVLAVIVRKVWEARLGQPYGVGGDRDLVLMQVKGLIENGWVLSNPHLGAPFGQDLHDYAANRELLHVLVVKLLGLFSSNPNAILNVYFLLSFPLVALAAFVVMRWIGISGPSSAAMAVVYALAPFHFRHSTFLFAYFAVPLGAYLILAVYRDAPLFGAVRRSAPLPLRYLTGRSALTLGACAAVALTSVYFAAFTVILVAMAAAISAVASRRLKPVLVGAVVASAIVVIGAISLTPDLVYRAQHGTNEVVAKRSAQESLLYGTNILQLVMPVQDHRLAPLARLHERWSVTSPVDGEATNLGLLATIGFVWLLCVAAVGALGAANRLGRDVRQRQLAAATLTALLLGTTGGISGVIAYVISPQFRAWTRLSVFIGFFALAAVALMMDAAVARARRRGTAIRPAVAGAVLVVICALAVLDQTGRSTDPAYDAVAASWNNDAGFAQQIERRLGDGAMIYQLPYVPFPEASAVNGVKSYDPVRPYLHTRTLKWSFGAMSGRPADWPAELADVSPPDALPGVGAAGFDGVYVDRAGYPDNGEEVLGELEAALGLPLRSADGRFALFDLRRYRARQRSQRTPAQLRALADSTLRPLRATWDIGAFSKREQGELEASRWTVVPSATVKVTNPSRAGRSATLSVRLARPGGSTAPVTVTYPDGSTETVDVPPQGVDVRRRLSFQSGQSTTTIATDGPAIAASSEVAAGYVQLVGWQLGPADL